MARVTHAFLPLLQRSAAPVIVNLEQRAGLDIAGGWPGYPACAYSGVAYSASKAARGCGGTSALADGYQGARVLFRRHPDLSLLYGGTDRMAMGAYDYLKETGRADLQDGAVVGFDNQLLIAAGPPGADHDRAAALHPV